MPDEVFQDRPIDEPSPVTYVANEADLVANNYPGENQRLDLLSSEILRLKRHLSWSNALAIVSLILAGILAGLMFGLKQQQDQQLRQVSTLNGDKAGVQNQLSSLNQQITSLNQQLTLMNKQMVSLNQQSSQKVSQTQLKPLIAIVQELNSKAVTKDQLNAVLQRVQPKANNGGQLSSPTPITPTP